MKGIVALGTVCFMCFCLSLVCGCGFASLPACLVPLHGFIQTWINKCHLVGIQKAEKKEQQVHTMLQGRKEGMRDGSNSNPCVRTDTQLGEKCQSMSSHTDVHKPTTASDRSYELSPASGDDVEDFTQDPGGQPFRVPLCCFAHVPCPRPYGRNHSPSSLRLVRLDVWTHPGGVALHESFKGGMDFGLTRGRVTKYGAQGNSERKMKPQNHLAKSFFCLPGPVFFHVSTSKQSYLLPLQFT